MLATLFYWLSIVILVIVALLVIFAIAWYIKTRPEAPWPKAEDCYFIPATGMEKIAGIFWRFRTENTGQCFQDAMIEAQAQKKKCVAFELFGGARFVNLLSLKDLEYVLLGAGSKFLIKHKNYARFHKTLGRWSLVALRDENEHTAIYRKVAPAFLSSSALKSYGNAAYPRHVRDFTRTVSEEAASNPNGEVSITKPIDELTINVITEVSFASTSLEGFSLTGASATLLRLMGITWTDLLPTWLGQLIPTQRERELKSVIGQLRSACVNAVEKTRSGQQKADATDAAGKHTLVHILADDKSLTADQLADTALTTLVAGSETTQKGIAWTLCYIAQDKRVQDKLVEELRDVCAAGAAPTLDDVSNCEYLNFIIKESLRIRPPVPWCGRQIEKELTLPSGLVLPEKMCVQFNMWVVHHNPLNYGKTVEEFIPERWDDNADPKAFGIEPEFHGKQLLEHLGPCGWSPFLPVAHKRSCIGYQFALNEMRVAVAGLVRSFELSWPKGVPEPERRWAITMRPHPEPVILVKRRAE